MRSDYKALTGLRRTRILRMCSQARKQGGLLSHEDLAYRLLNCGTRTIVRDVEHLGNEGLNMPRDAVQQSASRDHKPRRKRVFPGKQRKKRGLGAMKKRSPITTSINICPA